MFPPPLRSTLFPYTTLFRSCNGDVAVALAHRFAIGEEEAMVGRKLRIERDVQQSHLPNREHPGNAGERLGERDRKSTRLNSSHVSISYAVFCLKKKNNNKEI